MNETAQRKTIDLATGLFLIRYNTSDDAGAPPTVRVSVDSQSEGNCEILVAPGSADGTIWSPPGGLVVLATAPSKLVVEVTAQRPSGSTAANLKIEPLVQGNPPAQQFHAPIADAADLDGLRIMAHVAGIGDLTERSNVWIAGPTAPARIEGLCLHWPDKPRDLDISYAVKFARPQRGDNQMVPIGTFAGTRGRALPLTGLTFEASGPGASRYKLNAEAIFLGAPSLRATGQTIKLAGPTGREPLVGIKLTIEPVASRPAAPEPARTPLPPTAQRNPGRVRVFRSRQQAAKPAG